jgi:hypothetical protein
MRVTTQHQIHVSSSRTAQDDGVVCEQKLHLTLARTCQRQRKIFQANHRVVYASQPESLASLLEAHSLIH